MHGEEERKGRQEKGRQEALSAATGLGGVRATCTPDFFGRTANAATRSDGRRMDAPPACREAAALRYGERSRERIPHEGGDKTQMAKKAAKGGKKKGGKKR